MVKKSPTIQTFSNPCNGKGEAISQDWLTLEEFPPHLTMYSTVALTTGSSIGDHRHDGDAELYHLQSGRCKYNDNGTTVVLEAGDVVVCYDGETHGMINIGEEDAIFHAVVVQS